MAYYNPLALLLCLFLSVPAQSWSISDGCPKSISVTVPWKDPQFGYIKTVHEALISCPSVEALSISFNTGVSGYNEYNLPFNWSGGDRYPPLKSLRLDGYYFGEGLLDSHQFVAQHESEGVSTRSVWQGPRAWDDYEWKKFRIVLDWDPASRGDKKYKTYMGLNDIQRNKTNLDLWLDAMDWTKLQHLAIDAWCDRIQSTCASEGGWRDRFETLDELAPHLLSLRSFESRDTGPETMIRFLRTLPPHSLKTLAVTHDNIESTFDAITQSHGWSLEHLDLHSPFVGSSNNTLTPDQLRSLSKLPNLSHLGINLYRNGTWPEDHLTAISSIPQLRSVALYLDIPSEAHRQKQHLITGFWSEYLPPLHETRTIDYVNAQFESYLEMNWDVVNEAPYDNIYVDQPSRQNPDDIDTEPQPESDNMETEPPQYRTPILTDTSPLLLLEHMRDIKVGTPLEQLTLWIGDWRERVHAQASCEVLANDVRRYKVVCAQHGCAVEMEQWFE